MGRGGEWGGGGAMVVYARSIRLLTVITVEQSHCHWEMATLFGNFNHSYSSLPDIFREDRVGTL